MVQPVPLKMRPQMLTEILDEIKKLPFYGSFQNFKWKETSVATYEHYIPMLLHQALSSTDKSNTHAFILQMGPVHILTSAIILLFSLQSALSQSASNSNLRHMRRCIKHILKCIHAHKINALWLGVRVVSFKQRTKMNTFLQAQTVCVHM